MANWGAILAGLGGGASSLGQSMADREAQARQDAKDKAEALRRLAADSWNQRQQELKLGVTDDTGMPTSADVTTPMSMGSIFTGAGPIAALASANQHYEDAPKFTMLDPQTGQLVKKRVDEERTPEAIAFRRLLQQQEGQQKIAEMQAKAAADRATAAQAQMMERLNISQGGADRRLDRQLGAIGGTVQTLGPDGLPVQTAYTRGGETRTLGQAPQSAGGTGGRGSAQIKMAIANNRTSLALLDDADKEIKNHPEAVGLKRGIGMLPGLGEAEDLVNQSFDPKGVGARASLANIGSLVIHKRSGAAVTVSEFPRLKPFIPTHRDSPQAVHDKIAKLRQAIQYETDMLEGRIPYVPDPEDTAAPPASPFATSPAGGGTPASRSATPTFEEWLASKQGRP